MTESEAREKWCPFTAALMERQESDCTHPMQRCIASDCMAWRVKCLPGEGVPVASDYIGYCGLAGKP